MGWGKINKNMAKLIAELCSLNRIDNERHDVERKVNEEKDDSRMTFQKRWGLGFTYMVKSQLLLLFMIWWYWGSAIKKSLKML